MEILVEGEGTLTFWRKVSSGSDDELQFLLDGDLKESIDEEVDWDEMEYEVSGSGTHSFLWQYVKDGDEESDDGYDCGFVDCVQWTGSPPPPPPPPPPSPLAEALDSDLSYTTGGEGNFVK